MYSRAVGGTSRSAALAVMAAIVIVVGLSVLLLRHAAASSAQEADAVLARYAEVKDLAERYAAASAVSMKPSTDLSEARSSEFLTQALKRNRMSDLVGTLNYGDPKEIPPTGLQMVENEIECSNVPLSSVTGFLRDVEANRPNLALVQAELELEDPSVDSWRMHVWYGAIIQAKSRT